jgi:hypothetical protein
MGHSFWICSRTGASHDHEHEEVRIEVEMPNSSQIDTEGLSPCREAWSMSKVSRGSAIDPFGAIPWDAAQRMSSRTRSVEHLVAAPVETASARCQIRVMTERRPADQSSIAKVDSGTA